MSEPIEQRATTAHLETPVNSIPHSTDSSQIVQPVLAQVLRLYEAGRYLDSYAASLPLGDIRSWEGPEGHVLAGRLANNLGAPRLGRALHWKAYRHWPEHHGCLYYGALAYWSRLGPFHTWRKFCQTEMPELAEDRFKADWAALKSLLLAAMRDFMRAEQFMAIALQLDPNSAWIQVEHGELLDRQDRHEEALETLSRALELHPWFRPAIQSYGSKLIQANRDEEARQLFTSATEHLQSGEVWCQLAVFQQELKDFDGAWNSIQQAEKYWPLAAADSTHKKWLGAQMGDLAYFRGDYPKSLELLRQVDSPFYKRLVENLENALSKRKSSLAHRIQLPVPFIRQHHDTCAPATLTALVKYWNHAVEHDEVADRICYEGTASCDQRKWAEENGFEAREFRVTAQSAEELIRAGIPFTLHTVDPGSAHLQAIVGIDMYRGVFLIQDPSERHVTEAAMDKMLEHYESTGPRGMAMVPKSESSKLDSIELPDADLYDLHYEVDLALSEHRREDAGLAVKQMLKVAPDHRLTLQSQLAITRYDSNTPEHLLLTEKLLTQYPKDANLQLIRLSCLSELGTRDQRIAVLREACNATDSHPIFWTRLVAELVDDARQHPEAVWRLRRVLRGFQTDGRALALWSNLQWDQGSREEALESYRLAASVSEKDESFSRSYFSAARCLGKTEQATQWLADRLRRFGSRSTQPARTLSGAFEQLERLNEAIKILEDAAAQHPDDGELHCYLAMTLSRFNMREPAAKHLDLAKGKCPELSYIRACAAVAMYQGRSADARELLLQVMEREPLDFSALEQVVSLDHDLEGDAAAERRLREVVARFPRSYSLQITLIQWLRSHRLPAAQIEMKRFLATYPDSAWGQREAAILAISTHDLDAAEKYARQAIELEPNNDTAHFLLGRIAVDRGDQSQARAHFRNTLEKNCDHESAIAALLQTCDRPPDRREQLAFVLDQLRLQTTFGDGVLAYREAAVGKIEPDALLAGLEEARRNRPDLWQTWTACIQQLMAMNQRQRAVEIAAEATERFPLTPRMWVDLALVHRAMGNEEAELAALERARSINPNWVDIARELSDHYLKKKEYAKAEEVVRSVLAVDPRDPVALACLADCLFQSEQKQAALEPMSQACVQAPGYAWAWQMLTDWSHELDGATTVKNAARQLIDSRPHDNRGYLRYAESCHEIDDIPEGLEMIERSLQLDPRDVDAHVLKAHYLGRLHRWDDALEACEPAVYADQLPVALQMRRAYVLYRKGQLKAAAAAMHTSLQEDPDHYQGWSQLADWAEELEDLDLYKIASENLVRIDPHRPVPYGYLADALLRETDEVKVSESRALAKQYLRRAIELSPEYSYATQRLADLELEDDRCDEAQSSIDLGGQYLAEGYLESYQLRIGAKRSEKDSGLSSAVTKQLVDWCLNGPHVTAAMIQAVDTFRDETCQLSMKKLLEEARERPNIGELGNPLGRLLARTQDSKDAVETLQSLPMGKAWETASQIYVRSLMRFNRPNTAIDLLLSKFRKPLQESNATWTAVASAFLDYGRNKDVVSWTKDWPTRSELSLGSYITIIAANWDLFRVNAARKVLAVAVIACEQAKDEQHADLVMVWAGLNALVQGDVQSSLNFAQRVAPHNISSWYQLAYRVLIAGLELTPQLAENSEMALSSVANLTPGVFPIESQFEKDRVTQWFLWKIQASILRMYGKRLGSFSKQLRAWWIQFN